MSTDIVTEWLRFPYATVQEVMNYPNHTDLQIKRYHSTLTCSQCGQLCFDRYDRTIQRIRDLNAFEMHTYLILDKWRVHCPACGVRVEELGFAAPYSHYTRRFEDFVARLCEHMPLANVAYLLEMDWKTVKEIDKRALEGEFASLNYSSLRLLAIDEISYKKYHKYLTLVFDLERTSVVWVGKGRRKATLEAFFDEIGTEAAKSIEAIAIDMWDAFNTAIKARAPQAAIVFDKFHVIRNYSKVTDRVRLDEFKKAEK